MSLFGGIFGKSRNNMEVVRDRDGNWSYWMRIGAFEGRNEQYLEWTLANPVLFAVCAARAKLYSQMHITAVDIKTGEEREGTPEVALLNNPNYFQSKNDFFYQQSWFLSATGNNLIYQIRPFTSEAPKALYNLIPSEVDYKDCLKVNKFISTKQEMSEYEKQEIKYILDKTEYKLKLKDLIPLYDTANGLQKNGLLKSPSRIHAVSRNVLNIDENLKAVNINLQMSQKFLARNKNSINGSAGLIHDDDRAAIEDVLKTKSLQITNGDIEIQHLVTDLKKLYLNEEFSFEAATIANAFEMSRDVITYALTGSTFENQEKGIIRYIQSATQSDADNTMNSLTNSWGLIEKGYRLKASYDHLPIMQVLMNAKITTFKDFQEAIKIALENQTMDIKEATEATATLKKKLGL
jgi:hypothetical protein